MAKLNYDKDVKNLVNRVNELIEGKVEIRSKVDTWVLLCNKAAVYEGTLREIYCYLKGMLLILEA